MPKLYALVILCVASAPMTLTKRICGAFPHICVRTWSYVRTHRVQPTYYITRFSQEQVQLMVRELCAWILSYNVNAHCGYVFTSIEHIFAITDASPKVSLYIVCLSLAWVMDPTILWWCRNNIESIQTTTCNSDPAIANALDLKSIDVIGYFGSL